MPPFSRLEHQHVDSPSRGRTFTRRCNMYDRDEGPLEPLTSRIENQGSFVLRASRKMLCFHHRRRQRKVRPDARSRESPHQEVAYPPPCRTQSIQSKKQGSLLQQEPDSAVFLHDTWYYSSNHVLVNRERMRRDIPPLMRKIRLDEYARLIARHAAHAGVCIGLPKGFHGNVLRGYSIRDIHGDTMKTRSCLERANLLNPNFKEFGIATNKGEDGLLYLCQLFDQTRTQI